MDTTSGAWSRVAALIDEVNMRASDAQYRHQDKRRQLSGAAKQSFEAAHDRACNDLRWALTEALSYVGVPCEDVEWCGEDVGVAYERGDERFEVIVRAYDERGCLDGVWVRAYAHIFKPDEWWHHDSWCVSSLYDLG